MSAAGVFDSSVLIDCLRGRPDGRSRCRDGNANIAAMVAAIRQQVTVQPGGVIEIRSPELEPGSRAEVIVLLGSRVGAAASGEVAESTALPAARNGAGWRRHAGAMRGGAADASDSAGIDADLAREHLDPHEPQS